LRLVVAAASTFLLEGFFLKVRIVLLEGFFLKVWIDLLEGFFLKVLATLTLTNGYAISARVVATERGPTPNPNNKANGK
jgi:hypothetical protein